MSYYYKITIEDNNYNANGSGLLFWSETSTAINVRLNKNTLKYTNTTKTTDLYAIKISGIQYLVSENNVLETDKIISFIAYNGNSHSWTIKNTRIITTLEDYYYLYRLSGGISKKNYFIDNDGSIYGTLPKHTNNIILTDTNNISYKLNIETDGTISTVSLGNLA